MAGKEGINAQNVTAETSAEGQQRRNIAAQNDPRLAGLLQAYGSGSMSLQDALNQGKAMSGGQPDKASADWQGGRQSAIEAALTAHDHSKFANDEDKQKLIKETADKYENTHGKPQGSDGTDAYGEFQQMLATNPLTAQKFASEQLQSDGVMGKYFGKGGMQDQVLGAQSGLEANLDEDRNALKGKDESYGLNENDLKAYGQASGNIARQFGQGEQSLSQSLASRGLAQGASGSAGAQFSGLQGNKMEQLGQLQQQISQNRINTAKGLAEFRSNADADRASRNQQAALNLGSLGANAIGNARNQNMGAKSEMASETNAGAQQGRALNSDQQNQENNQFAQQQATRKKSFGEQLGDSLTGAVTGAAGSLAGQGIMNMNPMNGIKEASGAIGQLGGAAKGAGSLAAML